jgi:hypothetical protein
MNHDATHCGDYCSECPETCYRAQLAEDLVRTNYRWPISMASLKYTKLCPKWPDAKTEETE